MAQNRGKCLSRLAGKNMTNASTLTLGHPRFGDNALADIAKREGDLAAWRQAFREHGADAPRASPAISRSPSNSTMAAFSSP
jgi:hypothetical protein